MNATNLFIKICKMDKVTLKNWLEKELAKYYPEIINNDGFLYAKGEIPFAVTAHMDTVHKDLVKDVVITTDAKTKHKIISSPQGIGGDDRCGIFMILKLLMSGYRPTVIFCEEEEVGCVGSSKFANHDDLIEQMRSLNYIIELDRANNNDAVFYDCDNKDFTDYITTKSKYEEAYGSMSDISVIAPAVGIAAVNFSCGYYHAHTLNEYVDFEEMLNTISMVKRMLDDADCVQYEYIEAKYDRWTYGNWGSAYGGGNYRVFGYDDGYSYDDDAYGEEYPFYAYIQFMGNNKDGIYGGYSATECIGKALIKHPQYSFMDIDYMEFYDENWDLIDEKHLEDLHDLVKEIPFQQRPMIENIDNAV